MASVKVQFEEAEIKAAIRLYAKERYGLLGTDDLPVSLTVHKKTGYMDAPLGHTIEATLG